jgi:riboflavin kinase/FMN adenylyltransferase
MELVRGLHNLRPRHRGCVATIGNFDGVHRGHQAVFEQLSHTARAQQLPLTVITFEPQPREFFAPAAAPSRLTRLREKLQAMLACGIDRVVCLRFDAGLAGLPPADFIRAILVEGLDVRYLVVGDDFRFGRDRAGNFALLEQAGTQQGFPVVTMQTFDVGGSRVSSTRIRAALEAGDLETAASLLGRPYGMCGRVAHGDKRGRTIGYPTANIHLHRILAPVAGVFAVEMHGLPGAPLPGIANIGSRPTVGGTRSQLEVHLFDIDRDIYGCHVEVSFLYKIREEQRFETLGALQAQIQQDTEQAQSWFASR